MDKTKHINSGTLIVFHCPHDGGCFPRELLQSVIVSEAEFSQYHESMRDKDVSRLIPAGLKNTLVIDFPINRLLCDPERFIGEFEVMEKYGMGFCYEKAYDGKVIKKITPELLAATKIYYDEHHRKLDERVLKHDDILLIDLHSYHDVIVPDDFHVQGKEYPDICIGTDSKYTPPELSALLARSFREAGFTVDFNYPYAGTLIPNAVMDGRSACRLSAVMLEIHRRAYLDGNGAGAERIRCVIGKVLAEFLQHQK